VSIFKQRLMAAEAAAGPPSAKAAQTDAPGAQARETGPEDKTRTNGSPFVRVVSWERGRRMVAACAIKAGTELFCEDPILLVETQDRDLATVCGAAFAQFAAQPPGVQARILSFHTPADDCDESEVRKLAQGDPRAAGDVERYVQLGLIMKANSAVAQLPAEREEDTKMLGLGLYELGCRANHSCSPNACWLDAASPARPSEAAGRRLFRALRDIAAGEEITNDYLSEGMQTKATCERQVIVYSVFTFSGPSFSKRSIKIVTLYIKYVRQRKLIATKNILCFVFWQRKLMASKNVLRSCSSNFFPMFVLAKEAFVGPWPQKLPLVPRGHVPKNFPVLLFLLL